MKKSNNKETKLKKIIKRLYNKQSKKNLALVLEMPENTMNYQLNNSDNKVSVYKKYAWLLREYYEFKDDGKEWQWWELVD